MQLIKVNYGRFGEIFCLTTGDDSEVESLVALYVLTEAYYKGDYSDDEGLALRATPRELEEMGVDMPLVWVSHDDDGEVRMHSLPPINEWPRQDEPRLFAIDPTSMYVKEEEDVYALVLLKAVRGDAYTCATLV